MRLGIVTAALCAFGIIIYTVPANAHGGRTDSSGCHRERSSGTRHCHNGGSSVGDFAIGKSKKKRKGRKKRR